MPVSVLRTILESARKLPWCLAALLVFSQMGGAVPGAAGPGSAAASEKESQQRNEAIPSDEMPPRFGEKKYKLSVRPIRIILPFKEPFIDHRSTGEICNIGDTSTNLQTPISEVKDKVSTHPDIVHTLEALRYFHGRDYRRNLHLSFHFAKKGVEAGSLEAYIHTHRLAIVLPKAYEFLQRHEGGATLYNYETLARNRLKIVFDQPCPFGRVVYADLLAKAAAIADSKGEKERARSLFLEALSIYNNLRSQNDVWGAIRVLELLDRGYVTHSDLAGLTRQDLLEEALESGKPVAHQIYAIWRATTDTEFQYLGEVKHHVRKGLCDFNPETKIARNKFEALVFGLYFSSAFNADPSRVLSYFEKDELLLFLYYGYSGVSRFDKRFVGSKNAIALTLRKIREKYGGEKSLQSLNPGSSRYDRFWIERFCRS